MEYILSPSLLSCDFSKMGDEIKTCTEAGAKYLHFDVMDGSFVPNITFGAPVISACRKVSDAVFDVHLMIDEPIRYIDQFVKAGADIITVHYEAAKHLDRTLNLIKEHGVKAAVALNPATPVSVLENVLHLCDMVLIMTVNPGFGGQSLIPYALDKVAKVREMAYNKGLSLDIETDGGMTLENAKQFIDAGANIFVAGSSTFKGDPAKNIKSFLQCFPKD